MLSATAVAGFLVDRRARNCRPATLSFYADRLRGLATWTDLPTSPDPLRELLTQVAGSPASRHATYRALRALYLWLVDEELITTNPMTRVRAPRVPRKRKRTLDQVDVVQLLATKLSGRDRALVILMLDCGIRAGEARALRGRDIHDGWIDVCGKTGERAVPAHNETLQILREQITHRDQLVFRARSGNQLTRSGIYQLARSILKRADLVGETKNGTHLLRHTFGRAWIVNGGSLPSLKIILGHADIKTTLEYVELAGVDVAQDHNTHSILTAKKELLEAIESPEESKTGDHYAPVITRRAQRSPG